MTGQLVLPPQGPVSVTTRVAEFKPGMNLPDASDLKAVPEVGSRRIFFNVFSAADLQRAAVCKCCVDAPEEADYANEIKVRAWRNW